MLDYDWDNPSSIMLPSEDTDPIIRPLPVFDPTHHHHHLSSYNIDPQQLTTNEFHQYSLYTTTTPPYPTFNHPHTSSASAFFSFDQTGTARPGFLIPKTELDISRSSNRIGLNLGGRTYFSAADDDFVSRLYRRSRPGGESGMGNSPRCQAEGCNADLSHAKHYHRRHKVCEYHSKASTVIAAGLNQRFCQQCSRFHVLSEFDNGKRSCRKRLADHNRRRRKCHQSASTTPDNITTQQAPKESQSESAMKSSLSLMECFRTTASSSPSSSMFFSSGC